MSGAGALLFARYAYPPNSLGYCGPADSGALLQYAGAGVSDGGLVDLAARFEGAWPYLELIAACNGIPDPLDEAVVGAYWVGSPLLDRVAPARLHSFLVDRFRRRAGSLWSPVGDAVAGGGVPHHNLHVLAVYPWVGLLRAGHDGPEPLHVLDRCRIRWGTVLSVSGETAGGETAQVRSRALAWDGRTVTLGEERVEVAALSSGGDALVHGIEPGDRVSLHWDWVCGRLTPGELTSLRHYTDVAIAATRPPSDGRSPGVGSPEVRTPSLS